MGRVTLITGTVVGFVLVVDPDNDEGKRKRIESNDATELDQNYGLIEVRFLTRYKRDDNGVVDEQEGVDPSGSTRVGDPVYLATCQCGRVSWLRLRKESMAHLTDKFDCGEHGFEDDNLPGDNDRDEREY